MNPTKEQLLASPYRTEENISRQYKAIFIIPTEEQHDSGYNCIAIIGEYIENGKTIHETCTKGADDISWILPTINIGDPDDNDFFQFAAVRTDCIYPEGIFRYHGRRGYFTVSYPTSSIDITFTLLTLNND